MSFGVVRQRARDIGLRTNDLGQVCKFADALTGAIGYQGSKPRGLCRAARCTLSLTLTPRGLSEIAEVFNVLRWQSIG
jgi:hypothetical protein